MKMQDIYGFVQNELVVVLISECETDADCDGELKCIENRCSKLHTKPTTIKL